jgi:CHAT domain-containing protein
LTETDGLPPHLFLAEIPDGSDSGILTAERIVAEIRLRPGTLVVLAACESGEHQVALSGDDSALAPAFLIAGASTVIASLWPVHDRDTAIFMRRLYEFLLAGASPPSSLAAAQREARSGRLGLSLRAPNVWSAFVAYGR